jgi:hypothetical protein
MFEFQKENKILIILITSPNEEWDIYWVDVGSMKELFDHGYFEEQMRINHYRNHYEVFIIFF